ncbi:MAG: Holliday junction branch migration protein RuvA [Anaerolineaceae bacterium]|nr:Holliday junction branch migration protein RuvA [Anaerolineaceae bacterium]
MIASIRGEVIGKQDDGVIINVSGLGFQVNTTLTLADRYQPGDRISLFTHLHVRENALVLYGFESVEERHFFLLLNDVNGVGPKAALSILGMLSIEAIRRAVVGEQEAVFSRVPGIGKKTAQKILLHLQDKVEMEESYLIGSTSDVDTEILEALTALGYSVVEAQSAIQAIPRDTPEDLEQRLMIALQYFSS